MREALLRLARTGIDSKLAQLRAQIEELRSSTTRQLTQQIKEAGFVVGFAVVGTAAASATLVIALVALYRWVEMHNGPFAALAAVGAVTGLLAVVMFSLAFGRKRSKPVLAVRAERPSAAIPSPSPPPPAPSLRPVAAALSDALPRPPPNASLVEILTHRFSTHVAGASDEAIDAAAHVVRSGSRSALFGTLGAVVLVGVLIGRRQ